MSCYKTLVDLTEKLFYKDQFTLSAKTHLLSNNHFLSFLKEVTPPPPKKKIVLNVMNK